MIRCIGRILILTSLLIFYITLMSNPPFRLHFRLLDSITVSSSVSVVKRPETTECDSSVCALSHLVASWLLSYNRSAHGDGQCWLHLHTFRKKVRTPLDLALSFSAGKISFPIQKTKFQFLDLYGGPYGKFLSSDFPHNFTKINRQDF